MRVLLGTVGLMDCWFSFSWNELGMGTWFLKACEPWAAVQKSFLLLCDAICAGCVDLTGDIPGRL